MSALSPPERKLLDFLCDCFARRIRVKALRFELCLFADRLRDAGLIDGFAPTPGAFRDWEATRRPREGAAFTPPNREAANGGEGAEEHAAPSPFELAARVDAYLETRPKVSKTRVDMLLFNSRGGLDRFRRRATARKATVAAIEAFLAAPPPDSELAWIQPPRKRNIAPKSAAVIPAAAEEPAPEAPPPPRAYPPPRRDPTQPPPGYTNGREIKFTGDAVSREKSRAQKEAERLLNEGKPLPGTNTSVHVRIAFAAEARRREEEARLADPVESAKTVLRKRYAPVIGAEFADPPGRKGTFIVGRKLVTQAELLELAARERERAA